MTKICLFAGTTEGRITAEFLSGQDADLTVCTATDYGGQLIAPAPNIRISDRRLNEEEMRAMFASERFDLVIDATHPYAQQVTENIEQACAQTGTDYLRLMRQDSGIPADAVIVPDIPGAVAFLNGTEGNILLTTGSKDLGAFSGLEHFPDRVYARVLPLRSSLEACTAAGLAPSHILAMQGPFSEDLNRAMIRSVCAEWLVTKDGGTAGGFEAKAAAARLEGTRLIVIGRPPHGSGMDQKELLGYLGKRFGFTRKPIVRIVGIGPGGRNLMTLEAVHAVEQADCLIGAGRVLDAAPYPEKERFAAISAREIADYIRQHPEFADFAVLMSGDSSFYSGTKRLLPLLSDCRTEVLPGISSLSKLCAALKQSSENIFTVSLHGRDHDIIPDVRSHEKIFVLTGGENNVNSICRTLSGAGLGHLQLSVGENLSYPEEKITSGTAAELAGRAFHPLSVILIRNNAPDRIVTHGLPDETFSRDSGEKGIIPMTKSEIRSVCLSKLQLTERAVCWDIGSGTGSVSIEMALLARYGQVYAMERDAAAADLTEKNAKTLHASNVAVIRGMAPEACKDLPDPTHVFIGGSSGNIGEILLLLESRGKKIRVVVTAVSLNTVAEMTAVLNSGKYTDAETVMVQTSKAKRAGSTQLMLGGNPVYIFTFTIPGGAA